MAEFQVLVKRIILRDHPNADRLNIVTIDGYEAIVASGIHKDGDLVAYIPEQAIVPDELLEEMNLKGCLAGKEKNRVKAIKLRGIFSQGLCYPAKPHWEEGQDVTEELGIIKYEPPIPSRMAGQVYNAGLNRCIKYDLENIKKYNNIIQEGEPIVLTEKIHGTWCQVGALPRTEEGKAPIEFVVSSKGLAAKGLAFDLDSEENTNNLYVRAAGPVAAALSALLATLIDQTGAFLASQSLFVLGEVYGKGVQDLDYGANADSNSTLGFRVFDVYKGVPGQGRYLDDVELEQFCMMLGLERVPVLYRGPFNKKVLEEYTSGRESVSGEEKHIREGVVITPLKERTEQSLGRVKLKSVSEDYLLRKGGTEFN